jgi:hypothetical protein
MSKDIFLKAKKKFELYDYTSANLINLNLNTRFINNLNILSLFNLTLRKISLFLMIIVSVGMLNRTSKVRNSAKGRLHN